MIEEHEIKSQTTTVREPIRTPIGTTQMYDTRDLRREHPVGDDRLPFAVRRISWGAVFAGAVIASANQIAWTMLGAAIGLATINPAQETNAAQGLGIGAGIWWLLTGLVSLFLGGLVAGRLAGVPRRVDGLLNGVTVWGLTTVLGVWLVGSALGGMFNFLQTTTQTAAVTTQAAGGQQGTLGQLAGEAQRSLEQAGVDTRQAQDTLRQNIPQTQAEAQQAAETGAGAATWIFVALVLGAAAAAFGGWLSAPERTITVSPGERHGRHDNEPALNRS